MIIKKIVLTFGEFAMIQFPCWQEEEKANKVVTDTCLNDHPDRRESSTFLNGKQQEKFQRVISNETNCSIHVMLLAITSLYIHHCNLLPTNNPNKQTKKT